MDTRIAGHPENNRFGRIERRNFLKKLTLSLGSTFGAISIIPGMEAKYSDSPWAIDRSWPDINGLPLVNLN